MNLLGLAKLSFLRFLPILFLTGLIGRNAIAQEQPPLDADRPDFTESAIVVPRHSLQMESGYTFSRSGKENNHSIGELLFRYGFANWLEGRLAGDSLTIQPSSRGHSTGREDITLSTQIQLWRKSTSNKWRPNSSLILGTTLPTGEGENTLQPFAKWCLAWEIPLGFTAGTNFNYWHRREEGTSFGEWAGSLSIGHAITQRLNCYGEFYGFKPTHSNLSSTQYLDGGLTYLITPSFRVDFRLGHGFTSTEPDFFIGAGFVKRW